MKIKSLSTDNDYIDLGILIIITLFLISYFKPSLLLSETTTTGGDTASHYYSAYFMKNNLLPNGRVVGWTHGNYAGFPMFQFYFFLPFLAMALLSYLIPLQIAFKLVSVLGIFLLPITAYISMRAMKFRFPIPAFAAVFMLPFLFMEANSMWGGNIPSTLAGEFSYSISLALAVLFFGLLYKEVEKKKERKHLPLVILLVGITFTHVYTLLFVVASSAFFLVEKDKERLIDNLVFLFKVYFISFLLTSFWAIPMVSKLSYTTPFAVVWNIQGLAEVFPRSLAPFYLLAILGFFRSLQKRDDRILYVAFSLVTALLLYTLSTRLGIVDIRFVPFIQLFPLFISAYGLGELTSILRGKGLLPLIVVIGTILWVNHNVAFIPNWIDWNYEGFEEKSVWGAYNGVNEFLKGGPGDPRVVYEHSQLHNSAGTSRAFESLPLFSGRGTLEGLYMQSTVSSPFIFYIQSEISQVTSCPFPQWPCAHFDPNRAARHLAMFNVKHVVTRTDETKSALSQNPDYKLLNSFAPYSIFELKTNNDRYVVVPKFEPVLFETSRWKEHSYLWFLDFDLIDIPLVFTENAENFDGFKITKTDGSLRNLPKIPIERDCIVEEQVLDEEIKINTSCIGVPHIIRVSYFPNWKVEGAERVYLVSPSFMLVIPTQENVRLYYGRTLIDNIAVLLTFLGLALLMFERKISDGVEKKFPKSQVLSVFESLSRIRFRILVIGIILVIAVSIIQFNSQNASSAQDDSFGLELALATKRYTTCDARINDPFVKEECFKVVGIATGDYNLCDVRINNQELRDECFKEIGIATGDLNLCLVKIASPKLKTECEMEIKKGF
jgi:hypothetical protein